MKLTVRLLFLLISGLCCMSAQAVVDPYTVMEITPAEGDVTSLQNFTITFGGLPVTVNENAIPTLDKGANMTQAGHMRTDDDGTTVIVEFPDCWTILPESAGRIHCGQWTDVAAPHVALQHQGHY